MSENEETRAFGHDLSAEASASFTRLPCLVEVGGEQAGRIYTLSRPSYTLGRAQENDLQLDYEGVSRQHATLLLGPEGYVLVDQRSRNGVFINGFQVDRQALKDGDKVALSPKAVFSYREFDLSETLALGRLFEATARDTLTGGLNRKAFLEWLELQLGSVREQPVDLAVLSMAIDGGEALRQQVAEADWDRMTVALYGTLSSEPNSLAPLARLSPSSITTARLYTRTSELELLALTLQHKVARFDSGLGQTLTLSLGVATTREAAVPKAERLLEASLQKLNLAAAQGQRLVIF